MQDRGFGTFHLCTNCNNVVPGQEYNYLSDQVNKICRCKERERKKNSSWKTVLAFVCMVLVQSKHEGFQFLTL